MSLTALVVVVVVVDTLPLCVVDTVATKSAPLGDQSALQVLMLMEWVTSALSKFVEEPGKHKMIAVLMIDLDKVARHGFS